MSTVADESGKHGGHRSGAGKKPRAIQQATSESHTIYAKARAKKEAYNAQMAELNFKIKSGEYLPRDDIRQASSVAFAAIAQTLRTIPDDLERRENISPELALKIESAIDSALTELSGKLKKMHVDE